MNYVELHTHTIFSDGEKTPEELIRLAKKAKLRAIAITDHDSIDALPKAIKAGKNHGIEVISGIEITAGAKKGRKTKAVHVLGLFINYKDRDFKKFVQKVKKLRMEYVKKTVKNLQNLGVRITFDEVRKRAKNVIASPHIVEVALKNNPGIVKEPQEFYDKYMEKVKEKRSTLVTMKAAISAIKKAGGIAILAHPAYYNASIVRSFKKAGGVGLEAFYPYEKYGRISKLPKKEIEKIKKKYEKLAEKYDLVKCGSSDFHGKRMRVKLGYAKLTWNVVEELKSTIK
ncbi:MAG: PHP domain-containing protein [Candidatus Woesearchaeota archaeon]